MGNNGVEKETPIREAKDVPEGIILEREALDDEEEQSELQGGPSKRGPSDARIRDFPA
jgi:hypothetical protein